MTWLFYSNLQFTHFDERELFLVRFDNFFTRNATKFDYMQVHRNSYRDFFLHFSSSVSGPERVTS